MRISTKLAGESIRLGAIASLSLKVVNAALAILVSVLLARWLGKDGYGIFAFAIAVMNMAVMPIRLGLPALLVREVSRYRSRQDWRLMRGMIRRSNQLVVIVSAVVIIVAALVLLSNRDRMPPKQLHAHLMTLAIMPLAALASLRLATLMGLKRVIQGQAPELMVQPALTVILLLVARQFISPAPSVALAIVLIATSTAFAIGAIMLRMAIPDEVSQSACNYDDRRWLTSLVPFSLTALVSSFGGQVDIVLLGFLSDNSEVATYRVALALGMMVIFALSAVRVVLAPHIAHLHEIGDRARLQAIITKATWAITAVALPSVVVIAVFGETILVTLYGVEFRSVYFPLLILCAGQLFRATTGTVGMLLNMTGNERHVMTISILSVLLNLTLHSILIPRYGAAGAAVATAVTIVFTNSYLAWNAWKILGIQTTPIPFAIRHAKA